MNVNINNFDKICRTCLVEKVNMRPIFDAFVADMLMGCATIQIIESDDLPKSICIQCLQQVNRSYSFKQLCEKSDHTLRDCLKQSRCNLQTKQESIEELGNIKYVDHNGVTENKESVEYRIKTEQLKLEISEHLKLGIKVDCNNQTKIQGDEETNRSFAENVCNVVNEESEDNFQCNDCEKTFKVCRQLNVKHCCQTSYNCKFGNAVI